MADAITQVQPAPTPGAAPAPLQLKMFTTSDGAGGVIFTQAVCPADDQGRAINLMSEETGKEIVALLRTLIRTIVDNGQGGLYPSDGGNGLDH